MVEWPINLCRNIFGGESRSQAVVRFFSRCSRKTEKLIAVWPGVTAESFLDIRRYRLSRLVNLPRVGQATRPYADAGRVYVKSRSPGGWHTGAGGGAWVALLDRANTVSVGITRSTEQTLVYTGVGFPF